MVINKPLLVTFKASFYSEALKSISALCIEGVGKDTWNTLKWFPKKLCTFSEPEPYGAMTITAPLWLLQDMKIDKKVTTIKG